MTCTQKDSIRDYVLEELAGAERKAVESHLAGCGECAEELAGLRMTTAALRILPDVEIPRRIAFVSDKVFEPSRVARFFGGFWNSAARLGFASACLLAGALVFSAVHRPMAVGTEVKAVAAGAAQVDVDAAVRRAVAQVREEDAKNAKVALAAVEQKYDRKQRALMISVQESFEVMQKRMSSSTMLASLDAGRDSGRMAGQ